MIIRRELFGDQVAIDSVTSAAFGRGGAAGEPAETELLRALRLDSGWLPALSMVAVVDREIVGHVVCTRGWVRELPALGLGPISVAPSHQRRGIGGALMHSIIGAADAVGEPLIVLLGDEHFYERFGFVPAERLGIAAPDPQWGAHFQARTLTACPDSVAGAFRYAAPFDYL